MNAQSILTECARWQYDRCEKDRKLAIDNFYKTYSELLTGDTEKAGLTFIKACREYSKAFEDWKNAKAFLDACQIAAYEGLATLIHNAYVHRNNKVYNYKEI